MAFFSKMMLVPNDLGRTITDPTVEKVSSVHDKMSSVLDRKISNDLKIKQFRKQLLDYLHYRRQAVNGVGMDQGREAHYGSSGDDEYRSMSPPSISETPPPHIPTETQVDEMVTAITHRPEIVRFNPQGQLMYHGKTIPDTDILDLLAGAGPARKIFETGVKEALTDVSLPYPPPREVMKRLKWQTPTNTSSQHTAPVGPHPFRGHKVIKRARSKLLERADRTPPLSRVAVKRAMHDASDGVVEKKIKLHDAKRTKHLNNTKRQQSKRVRRQKTAEIMAHIRRSVQNRERQERMDQLNAKMSAESDIHNQPYTQTPGQKVARKHKAWEEMLTTTSDERRALRKRKARGQMSGPPRKYMRVTEGVPLAKIIEKAREQRKLSARKKLRKVGGESAATKLRRATRSRAILKNINNSEVTRT
jgi:hypothetical protein